YANNWDLSTYLRNNAYNWDLRTYLRNNPQTSWIDKVELTRQVVAGLKFFHDKKIIRVEFHPKNILMYDSIPKLTNIGIAKFDFCEQLDNQISKDGLCNNFFKYIYRLNVITTIGKLIDKGLIVLKFLRMKEIAYKEVYNKDQIQEFDCVPDPKDISYTCNPISDNIFDVNTEHLLEFDFLEQQRERKKLFVKRFSLTKDRNKDEYDFVLGKKHILDNNGRFNAEKIEHFTQLFISQK
ncbi:17349_t:CDS:2, partial [Gigaspora rosea]